MTRHHDSVNSVNLPSDKMYVGREFTKTDFILIWWPGNPKYGTENYSQAALVDI